MIRNVKRTQSFSTGLIVLALSFVASCQTMKGVMTGNKYADLPDRAAWIRKTSRWLTESRRLALYETSPQYDRMKGILKRFNIKTLYLFSGETSASYAGYRDQGLFTLCQRLKKDGFTSWANFPHQRWYRDSTEMVSLKIMATQFAIDNKAHGDCFAGIHLELQDGDLQAAEMKQVQKFFKELASPVSLRAHSNVLAQVSKFIEEGVALGGLERATASVTFSSGHRQNLNLALDKMAALDLDGVEQELKNLEPKDAKVGAAIFTLEHLLKKYDREEPSLPMMR